MTELANMNERQRYAGICVDEFGNNRVYIGAGYESKKTFEYYDINKNLWILLSNTKDEHSAWPIVWNDQPNAVNIASTTSHQSFERMDI